MTGRLAEVLLEAKIVMPPCYCATDGLLLLPTDSSIYIITECYCYATCCSAAPTTYY